MKLPALLAALFLAAAAAQAQYSFTLIADSSSPTFDFFNSYVSIKIR